jgi:hypothetical protein
MIPVSKCFEFEPSSIGKDMNTTKTTSMILAAAVAGLMTGATAPSVFAGDSSSAKVTISGKNAGKSVNLGEKAGCSGKDGCGSKDKGNACKGHNDCKGKGGCKSGDNGCKGKNSCKGKGGCKTTGKTGEKDKAAEKPADTK